MTGESETIRALVDRSRARRNTRAQVSEIGHGFRSLSLPQRCRLPPSRAILTLRSTLGRCRMGWGKVSLLTFALLAVACVDKKQLPPCDQRPLHLRSAGGHD